MQKMTKSVKDAVFLVSIFFARRGFFLYETNNVGRLYWKLKVKMVEMSKKAEKN